MSLTQFGGHVGEKHKTSRPPANKGLQKRVKGEPLVWTCVVALSLLSGLDIPAAAAPLEPTSYKLLCDASAAIALDATGSPRTAATGKRSCRSGATASLLQPLYLETCPGLSRWVVPTEIS
jgi:hypothetical protein